MYGGRRAIGTAPGARGVPGRADVAVFRQFGLLLSRYWKIKMRDRAGAAIMFLQAPIIGVLLWMVFGGQTPAVPFWCLGALQELSTKNNMSQSSTTDLLNSMQPTMDHTAAMFFVVVSCVWFGTSNAAREIVTERSIYLRERMVNLRLFNYVVSKFVLLSLFCVIQCTCLLGIIFFALGFNGGPVAFLLELGERDGARHQRHGAGSARVDHGLVGRGGDGPHAHRAHPAGRARRSHGPHDDQPEHEAA